MRIDPLIRNLAQETAQVKKPAGPGTDSFTDQLKSKVAEVDQLQQGADQAMADGALKGATNIHETMIRLEEADCGLRLLTKLRNKAIDAYHEMMRMQF